MTNSQRATLSYRSFEDFVLAYGRAFEAQQLDPTERALMERVLHSHHNVWDYRFAYNQCFMNAQRLLALDDTSSLVYVEGFVWLFADGIPPVHHGWLSLKGKVIDVTAPTGATARRRLPPEPPQVHGKFEGRAYFGVSFLLRYVRERSKANMGWGSLLDDEENDYRLLARGGDGAIRRV